MKKNPSLFSMVAASVVFPPLASATEFEPLAKAIAAELGTTQAFKKKYTLEGKEWEIFYSKGTDQKPLKLAAVQKGIFEPDCTHTWVVGMSANPIEVKNVRVVEMSCPHAFPTKTQSFLSQYEGKKESDLKTLDQSIVTVAKATGSAVLTTDAVKRSIRLAGMLKTEAQAPAATAPAKK